MSCFKLVKSCCVLEGKKKKTEISQEDVTESELDLTAIDSFLESLNPKQMEERRWKGVAMLKELFMDPPTFLLEINGLKQIESMLREIVSIISCFDLTNMDYKTSHELKERLIDYSYRSPVGYWYLIEEVNRHYQPKRKPSREAYPRIGLLGFIDHLAGNLEQLLKDKPHQIRLLRHYILDFQQKLQYMSSKLIALPQLRKEDADVKDLIQSITNLAYEVEYAIDSCLVRDIPMWYCMIWFPDILKEFDIKVTQVEMESGGVESIVSSAESIVNDILYSPFAFGNQDRNRILAMIDKSQEFDIIHNINNTKISDKVYKFFYHPKVESEFQLRTWSQVSSYKERKREVFLQLLHNAVPKFCYEANTSAMSTAQLKSLLSVHLRDHPIYLVILEGMEDIDALYDIKIAVPNCLGVILVITPSPEVAMQCRYFSEGVSDKMLGDHTSMSQMSKPTIDNDVVGFLPETQRMLERLIGESKRLCIILIVGMAGQGNTTLAMKLFNEHSVVEYFHIRLWCNVSQVYQKKGLLLELLGQVVQLSNIILDKNVEELAEMLYKHLKGRTFLVLLDDVWMVDAWNDISRCFPNDNNGSRILFTTRIEELASQTNSMSIVQRLSFLSHEESWELLKKKVFEKESCPHELIGVGKKIAESCKGLPLSVVLTAGFLEKIEKNVDQWEQIENTLSSRILSDVGAQGRSIIEMSYKHLPDHLRPCFLYFGAFLEDKEVSVSKLVRLWIAEGFIKCSDLKSLEGVAEDYLMDLIRRSLVTVAREKSNGGVKLCRIHDLLHEFCFTKAKEENFMQQIKGCHENFHFSTIHIRRVSIHSKRDQFDLLEASKTLVRSLFYLSTSDLGSSYSFDISFISHNFKLLTILDLEDIKIGYLFKEIILLVLLRYLAVQCYMPSIPLSIADLWNLETFIFKGLSNKVVNVPYSIWNMTKLRHVCVSDAASFGLVPNKPEMSVVLDNLQTFSTPSLAYGDDMEKALSRLPSIRKLKCIFLNSGDDVERSNQLPKLEFLCQLVSLRARYNGEVKDSYKFNLPSSLRKLTLANFRMSCNEISQLAKLHNLEVLKLEDNAIDGETWEMEDEVFQKLKFLKLDTLNLVKWSGHDDNFPHLENLVLHKCEQLEEIPSNIGENTLQMIKVMWCSPVVATYVKEIQEERLDYNNEVEILIHPKVCDLKSSS